MQNEAGAFLPGPIEEDPALEGVEAGPSGCLVLCFRIWWQPSADRPKVRPQLSVTGPQLQAQLPRVWTGGAEQAQLLLVPTASPPPSQNCSQNSSLPPAGWATSVYETEVCPTDGWELINSSEWLTRPSVQPSPCLLPHVAFQGMPAMRGPQPESEHLPGGPRMALLFTQVHVVGLGRGPPTSLPPG